VPAFHAPDGTELAYHLRGVGAPLICLPGGPMRASVYLGDLGGLPKHRQLVLLDLRGTGQSAVPADPSSYRCDRLVGDVVGLMDHLGLENADVLAHSAGANIAVQYSLRHRARVHKLALITPSGRAVDLEPDAGMRREVVKRRKGEPWFAAADAAYERVCAGQGNDDDWEAMSPFFYGRWDAAARAHDAAGEQQVNESAAAGFGAEGAFDPPATRVALDGFDAPVLVLGGDLDLQRPPRITAELAALFPQSRLVFQPGAGHYPWLDDPARFVSAVTAFLGSNL
jgi:proline iminopeptidase